MHRGRDQGPRGGAEHLARIHGTEEDKVNCPFYFKIGACRHGDKCSRHHNKPPFSQTILVPHMWPNPMVPIANAGGDLNSIDHKEVQEEFDDFFAEIFEEFHKFGKIEEIDVCENLGDHLVGNVYVKYEDEEFADAALQVMNGRFYAGRCLTCEFSPVTDFREARCRQYDEGNCDRGPYCNFMHVRVPGQELKDFLEKEYKFIISKPKFGPDRGGRGGGGGGGISGGSYYDRGRSGGGGNNALEERPRERERERSKERRDRSRDRDRDRRDRSRDRDKDRDRDRDRDRRHDSRDRGGRDRNEDRRRRDDPPTVQM